jgi:hypothetical protein
MSASLDVRPTEAMKSFLGASSDIRAFFSADSSECDILTDPFCMFTNKDQKRRRYARSILKCKSGAFKGGPILHPFKEVQSVCTTLKRWQSVRKKVQPFSSPENRHFDKR